MATNQRVICDWLQSKAAIQSMKTKWKTSICEKWYFPNSHLHEFKTAKAVVWNLYPAILSDFAVSQCKNLKNFFSFKLDFSSIRFRLLNVIKGSSSCYVYVGEHCHCLVKRRVLFGLALIPFNIFLSYNAQFVPWSI